MGTFWGHPLKVFPSPIMDFRFICVQELVFQIQGLKSALLIGFRLTNNCPKLRVAFSVSPNCLGV